MRIRDRGRLELSGSYFRARTAERGRRIGLLPRVSQRPLELPALHRSAARSGLRRVHVRLSQSRGQSDASRITRRCNGRPTARSATCGRRWRYLRSRPDRDPAGFGLFGVSRGGTTALLVAADEARRLGGDHRRSVSRRTGRWSPTCCAGPRSMCGSRSSQRLLPTMAVPRAGVGRTRGIGADG